MAVTKEICEFQNYVAAILQRYSAYFINEGWQDTIQSFLVDTCFQVSQEL